ncbi:hypothetical protein B0H15DRAFT_863688 [Mycena belliarum]|uniref:DUF7143 domain-containing protein n=1 Tax=Mycena belliarum TaxID=1033014 RepID=A0AAD6TW01_9AGAR|nr:hypothetical protein B0H15DRAFT_863688 [Mycena belliae]
MFPRSLVLLSLFAATAFSAPLSLFQRANPCFVTGSVALPAEITSGLSALSRAVRCNAKIQVAPGVPDITSGKVAFSKIDFQKSSASPLGFALATFKTPKDPAKADLATLQNQLNVYLALEAGVRSQPNSKALLAKLKGPKFFLQFQIARVQTAKGVSLGVADTVEHQLGKVTKNAVGASASEIAQVNALAKQV